MSLFHFNLLSHSKIPIIISVEHAWTNKQTTHYLEKMGGGEQAGLTKFSPGSTRYWLAKRACSHNLTGQIDSGTISFKPHLSLQHYMHVDRIEQEYRQLHFDCMTFLKSQFNLLSRTGQGLAQRWYVPEGDRMGQEYRMVQFDWV